MESAKATLANLNPEIEIRTHAARLETVNAAEIASGYDFIIDGSDNFDTKFLVNDIAIQLGIAFSHAGIVRLQGQTMTVIPGKTACYRCLFPEPPPPGLVPSCAEGGVLGVLPGVIGVIQAIETVKLILGKGDSLIGRLMLFDALKMKFRELKLRKNPDCPVCGESPTVSELIDYEEFCGVPAHDRVEDTEAAAGLEILPAEYVEIADKPDVELIDVREPHEYEISRIEGAELIPLGELPSRLKDLDSSEEIVLHCRTGGRSMEALHLMRGAGFSKLKNLHGGINAYAKQVDDSIPVY